MRDTGTFARVSSVFLCLQKVAAMIVVVRMLAFGDGELRPVNVPDAEVDGLDTMSVLEKVWHYGQNDIQPVEDRYSVSVGDVVLYRGELFIARPCGWALMTPAELERYEKLDHTGRLRHARQDTPEHKRYINHYRCSECGTSWDDEWDCTCNDRCPKCNAEIEPHSSDEIEAPA